MKSRRDREREKLEAYKLPEPVERDKTMGDRYEHESFGTIYASRYSGGSGRMAMFGSKVLHHASGVIRVEISPATYWRGLHNDRIHSLSNPLVAVEMTEAQWAHLHVDHGTPSRFFFFFLVATVRRWNHGSPWSFDEGRDREARGAATRQPRPPLRSHPRASSR